MEHRTVDPGAFGLSVKQSIRAFRKANRKKGYPLIGTRLTLPGGQIYVFKGKLHWNYATGQKRVSYQWESHCAVCYQRYSFNVPSYADSLVRTCSDHRGQMPRARKPQTDKPKLCKRTPLRDIITAQLAAASLVAASIPHEDLTALCVAHMPRGASKRDTRAQRIREALQGMIDSATLPCSATADSFVF